MIDKTNLKVEYVPAEELNPAEYNPRQWEDSAVAHLTESIERFGLVDPLIVNSAPNRENVVIGGHFRLHIAKELDIKEVPVVYLNIPDVEREKELNLRLNRNTGDWDLELLKEFDIGALLDVGFDDADLSDIWDDVLEIEDDYFDTEKELEELGEPETKPGQLFQLGKHKLFCGDATNAKHVAKLVADNQVDMIYNDPPYNISLDYNKGIGTSGKYGGTKTKDDKTREEYTEFIRRALQNSLSVAKEDTHIFTWCDENYIGLIQELYAQLGISLKRVCLWIKNNQNVTPQIAFNKAYEPCVYGTIGSPFLSEKIRNLTEVLNKEVGSGNRLLDDIEDYLNIWLTKRLPAQDYEHPTEKPPTLHEKPPTLHEKPLRRCTKPGDVILDLFGGSGSTLIACEQLKRTAYLMEIEPIFCDLIIRRFERISNEKARLIN
ncbi:MAG: DNA methyltransferase [Patescibacteria group bacterium]|nr:DNA methyltransferase [Patescibacteria group bacterium]